TGGKIWHLLDTQAEIAGAVEAVVEPGFRTAMTRLHTATHILNALVFQQFDGALVTGVQMNEDPTPRLGLDLPAADNDRLRALEPAINDVIRQSLAVQIAYVPMDEAAETPGLLRSRSVTPPPGRDGKVRIVEIVGLDRQACGGTHLTATGACGPI